MPRTHESLIDTLTRVARSADRRLMVEAAVVLLLVRVALWTLPYATVRRLLGRIDLHRHASSDELVSRVARVVTSVARRIPLRMTCLVEALAAQAMLRRRGRDSVVRFGVRGRADRATTIESHAWLEHDGAVIVGRIDDLREYAVLNSARRV